MNKILVLYKSKYGATREYVEMLKNEIACDVYEIDKYKLQDINQYELIIFAGGIYASGISVMKYIKRNIKKLKDINLIIFAVGASPYDKKAFQDVIEHNLKDISLNIPVFYGRGSYDEDIMNFKDRTLCQLLKKSLSKKDPSTFEPWMKALFEADGKSSNWINKTYLKPVLEYVKRS